MVTYLPPKQTNNPTPRQRDNLLQYALYTANRPEDFGNIKQLLDPPPDITSISPPGSCNGIRVGIIGGGAAGLASAFELRKLGFDITVFEALEDRIGGRVYTYYFDKKKELYNELGPMRIPVGHNTTWHYIDLFKLKTRPFVQTNENAFIYVRNVRTHNRENDIMQNIYPQFKLRNWEKHTPWHKLLDFIDAPLYTMPPSVRTELLEIKPDYLPQIEYLNSLNLRQELELMQLTEAAISLISSVSPLTGSFYYNSYTETLSDDYSLDFSFLYEIVGGLVKLPLAFYNSLISSTPNEYCNIPINMLGNVTWKQGERITGIYYAEANNKVILKHINKHFTESVDYFDYVICAIPFSSLRTIETNLPFSNRKLQAIREVNYNAAQKTLFLCNKRFWELGGPNKRIVGGGSYTDLPISVIWYPSDHAQCLMNPKETRICYRESPLDAWTLTPGCSPEEAGVLLASYNVGLDAIRLGGLNDELRFELIKRQVERVHGLSNGYLDSVVTDFKTIQWNIAEPFYGAFSTLMPEQKDIFLYSMTQPEYNCRLFFAGEHISTKPRWLQGALSSGMQAANALAYYCKINLLI